MSGTQIVVRGTIFVRREGGSDAVFGHLVDAESHLWVVSDGTIAVVRHEAMLTQRVDDSLGVVDGPKVLDDDGTVWHDKDNSGESTDLVGVTDACSTSWATNGRIFHSVIVDPVLAGCIIVAVRDFDVEHIVHIAPHGVVRLNNFRSGLLARTTVDKEEIDEHGLATVEDIKQVHFSAMAVGSCEVNSCCERALRFQAKAKGQRENEGKYFFHR